MKQLAHLLLTLIALTVLVQALIAFVNVSGVYALTLTGRIAGNPLQHAVTLAGLVVVILLSGHVGSRNLKELP
ncbi:hypothetical protein Dgeo_3084 (plasmid) [Deinococcus geothermalis DSM 11300]|uniref:Uncharacterized protein n=1 Tax=Deinococcus geothermalis (strain DSM 11300 / CIP 105573 / AG-3a) TaxID=319795 RepID=A8ZRL6_DEIGD|nr:hypothetical protein [Deinococcus geothermalis]ABW35125.1 hypothetical protein Dgeo_3084 [Deinococcus geothermalis DSM 11300]